MSTQAGVADKEDEAEEFSPEVVAEYLYQTGDFDRFYTTLAQLVNNSVVSTVHPSPPTVVYKRPSTMLRFPSRVFFSCLIALFASLLLT